MTKDNNLSPQKITFWDHSLADKTGVLFDAKTQRRYSYRELSELADKYITVIPNEKQLIAVKARNNISTLAIYIAALRGGHVCLFISDDIAVEPLEKLCDQYQINWLFSDNKLKLLNTEILNITANLAVLLSTSGSTGSPKSVKLSYKNILSNCQSICQYLPINEQDTVVTSLPIHYSFGLSIINTHLMKGASIILTDANILQKEYWQYFKEFKPTAYYGVPYSYEMLLKLKLARLPFDSIKYFAVAGGKLLPDKVLEIAKWCQQKQKKIYVMYGQTEATARISYLEPDKTSLKPHSIGNTIPNGQLWLENESGVKITNINEKGELCYSGDNVMMGLASSVDDLAEGDSLEKLHTGDLAIQDEDGDYTIVGRIKRFIKIVGKRINLDEVQAFTQTITESVVMGDDDDLQLFYCQKNIDVNDLVEQLADYLSVNKNYISTHYVESFSRLENGKLDYSALKSKFYYQKGAVNV